MTMAEIVVRRRLLVEKPTCWQASSPRRRQRSTTVPPPASTPWRGMMRRSSVSSPAVRSPSVPWGQTWARPWVQATPPLPAPDHPGPHHQTGQTWQQGCLARQGAQEAQEVCSHWVMCELWCTLHPDMKMNADVRLMTHLRVILIQMFNDRINDDYLFTSIFKYKWR